MGSSKPTILTSIGKWMVKFPPYKIKCRSDFSHFRPVTQDSINDEPTRTKLEALPETFQVRY